MLGHYSNVEKSQLVNYVEDYLECVESLPLDIQRNVSLLREIDTKYQGKRNICERCQLRTMYVYTVDRLCLMSYNTKHMFILRFVKVSNAGHTRCVLVILLLSRIQLCLF